MAYQQNEGQGSMFLNDKQGNPNRPDYTGTIVIGGVTYRIVGWFKVASTGNQFLSLKAELPQQGQAPYPQQGYPQAPYPQMPPQPMQQTGQFPAAPVGQPYAPQYPQYPQAPAAPQYAPKAEGDDMPAF